MFAQTPYDVLVLISEGIMYRLPLNKMYPY